MSHFATIKTKMTNRNVLVAALETMGYTVEVHDQSVELVTKYNRYANNQGQMANVIIRRETLPLRTLQEIEKILADDAAYYQQHPDFAAELKTATVGADIGFTLQDDGTYAITADTFYLAHERIQDAIPHQYAKAVITQQAESLGHDYTVTERRNEQDEFIGWQVTVQPEEIEYMGVSSTYNSASLISQY